MEAHARWLADYNAQIHWAHRERADGRRSPEEVLGWLAGVRYRDEDLERAFFSTRFTRKLDALGYARFCHWRLYAEEALAGREAAVWLEPGTLTMEYAGEALSRYEVRRSPDGAELHGVGKATMLETSIVVHQPAMEAEPNVVASRKGALVNDVLREEPALDVGTLRLAIQEEYAEVASHPHKGFHFHTGRPLARMLEYLDEWLEGIPESSIESFAGTGNPFSLGELRPGERVVDVGCGAGIDSLVAAKQVTPEGWVIGVDMTPSMLEKARRAAEGAGLKRSVEFREGYAEALPVEDGWADVVISNGVLNLMPDKDAALAEMSRVLKPRGRLQIGDILVQKAVPESA